MRKRFSLRDRKTWVILGGLALLLRFLLGLSPELTETIYSNGLFIGIRYLLDYTIGLLPVPFTFVLLLLLLVLVIRRGIKRRKRERTARSFVQRLINGLYSFAAVLSGIIFLFMFLWGFNYARMPLEEKVGMEVSALSLAELKTEANRVLQEASQSRALIDGATDSALLEDHFPENLEEHMRVHLELALVNLGYPAHGEVRCRVIRPNGWMRGLGIQGIYNPFTGEGNVDGAADPRNLPFTMAHEMAHGYGFTNEGTCNFLAFLACMESKNPFIQYCGWENLLRYCRAELRDLDPTYYDQFVENMPEGIKSDRKHTIALAQQHPMWFENFSRGVNDIYLKAQGIEAGTKSYDRLVSMAAAYHRFVSKP